MNDYSKVYKTLSTSELIDIIKNKEEYSKEAVTYAEIELTIRDISYQDIILNKNSNFHIYKSESRVHLEMEEYFPEGKKLLVLVSVVFF